jgi:hypothetical protein
VVGFFHAGTKTLVLPLNPVSAVQLLPSTFLHVIAGFRKLVVLGMKTKASLQTGFSFAHDF